MQGFQAEPTRDSYDVVIVGGAIMGSSAAWWLTRTPGLRVLVLERDPTYAQAGTTHTNSCIRQQFSTALNVQISQFTAGFVQNLRDEMGGDPAVPNLNIQNFGYMYLSGSPAFSATLRANQAVQLANGAETRLLTPDQIKAEYPFYAVDDLELGSINTKDEGYFDGSTLFDCFRRQARAAGVEYVADTVVGMTLAGGRVVSVCLASGRVVGCGWLVNASGPRGAKVAAMAGIALPVEPRKRHTWIIRAEQPLDRPLPLTIDPSGVHVREVGGGTYMVGGHADADTAVDHDDFALDHGLWEGKIWPTIATRIPAFEAVKVQAEWVGHYDYNTLDQNAVVGPHPEVANFLFMNGFSGHGLQQSPAMGRGVAEWIMHGSYQTLDLSAFGYERVVAGRAVVEGAII